MTIEFNRKRLYDEDRYKDINNESTNDNDFSEIDENNFNEFVQKFAKEKDALDIDTRLDKVHKLIKEQRIDEAYKVAKNLCDDFEKGLSFNNTGKCQLYSVTDSLEFLILIFSDLNNKDKNIRNIYGKEYPYYQIYKIMAYILIELNDLEGAENAILKALRWNPVSSGILLEQFEIEARKQNWNKAKSIVLKALKYVSSPSDIAMCYRKLGYAYTEENNLQLSSTLYRLSLHYEDNVIAHNELDYIRDISNNEIKFIDDYTEATQLLLKNNIPIQISKNTLMAFIKLIKLAEEENDKNAYDYYENLLSDLIIDADLLKTNQVTGE